MSVIGDPITLGVGGNGGSPVIYHHLAETNGDMTTYQLLESVPLRFHYKNSVIYMFSMGNQAGNKNFVISTYQFWHKGQTKVSAGLGWARSVSTYTANTLAGAYNNEAVNCTIDSDGRIHVPNQVNYYIAQGVCNIFAVEIPVNSDTGEEDLTLWGE